MWNLCPVMQTSPPRTAPSPRPRPPALPPPPARTTYRHGRPVRSAGRGPGVLALTVAVALAGGLLVYAKTQHVPAPPAPLIDWPAQGQSAYTTSSLDEVRSSGSRSPQPIASVAKLMTAYVVLQLEPLDPGEDGPELAVTRADVTDTGKRRADGESVVSLKAGEELTELQALQALLLPSANNVAMILARETGGSVGNFVDRMNDAADDLGMDDTEYTDPSGMDDGTVSTAGDQVLLLDAAWQDPVLAAVLGTRSADIPVAGRITTTDALLGQHGIVGGKTGSHDAAGGCFAFRAVLQVGGRSVTVTGVVLGQRGGPLVQAALTAADELLSSVAASTDVGA
jgi:D-alanyl-D-alanine carboxypeptidase (penicillin-binding protein 5/6)